MWVSSSRVLSTAIEGVGLGAIEGVGVGAGDSSGQTRRRGRPCLVGGGSGGRVGDLRERGDRSGDLPALGLVYTASYSDSQDFMDGGKRKSGALVLSVDGQAVDSVKVVVL